MSYSLPVTYVQPSLKTPSFRFSLSRMRQNHRGLFIFLIISTVVVVLGLFGFLLARLASSSTLGTSKVNVNQTYPIMARDQNGRPLGKDINFRITDAQKATSVLIQGKKANVRNNKIFLLLDFEIDNPDNINYFINPTDLVRYLRADGKKFAPTVYQGLLQVRPASTKSSNIGFVVDENEKNFTLEVGDLDGTKQSLEVKF